MSYTTTTNKLKITELDFDAIKGALKTYLGGQTEFKDYDFEGSAMNILLDILAYNTHYNGFYTNMLASEMFMDSASLRSSVVSLAKHLGYVPSSKKGCSINLDLSFVGSSGLANILIPKNSKFTSKIDGETYTFLTTEARTASPGGPSGTDPTLYDVSNLKIKEGFLFSSTQIVVGSDNEIFTIPNEDVDTETIFVALAGEIYKKADDYTEITSTSKVYFLQEGRNNQYEIYFGDGAIGAAPNAGDTVQIDYNISQLGSGGNGAKVFSLAESLSGVTSVTISLSDGYVRTSGGAEREDISTIRIQAPRQYALQKRVVTAQDYSARLTNDYDIVDSVRVWGGEENIPPQFGKVFISIKPKAGYVLSKREKKRIAFETLKKRNMITITPEFVDPDYLFIIPDVTISYDPRRTTRTAEQLSAAVKTTIINYSSEKLGKFDDYFRHSSLTRVIDDTEISIMNNYTNVAIKKRIKPLLRVAGAYRMFFDNPLYRPHSGHRNILTSTMFTYNGRERCSLIDQNGVIKIVQTDFKTDTKEMVSPGYQQDPSLPPDLKYGDFSGKYQFSPVRNPVDVVTASKMLTNQINNPIPGRLPSYLSVERNKDGAEVVGDIGRVDYETGEVFVDNFNPTSILDNSEYIYVAVKPRISDILPIGNTILTIEDSDIAVTAIDDTDRLPQLKTQSY